MDVSGDICMVLADSITVTERIARLGNRQGVKEEDFAGWAVNIVLLKNENCSLIAIHCRVRYIHHS